MSRRITNGDENRIINMDDINTNDIEAVDIRAVATTSNEIVQTGSTQQVQCSRNDNFMQLPQQQRFDPGNSSFGQILANHIVEQPQTNRALADIMRNAVTFRSESTDYFSQNVSFADSFSFNRTVPLNYGSEMKIDDNAQMNEIRQNIAKLNAFQQTLDANKIDMDKVKAIGKDYHDLLTRKQSIGNIVKIDAAEHKINTLRADAEYKITATNVKDSSIIGVLQNNAKILEGIRDILSKVSNIDNSVRGFFTWLFTHYNDPASDDATAGIKGYCDLMTILNFLVTKEMNANGIKTVDDAKKLAVSKITVIAAKIVNTVVTYYTALKAAAARVRNIQDFDQLIEALQDVARDYVMASPQLANAVQGMSNIMSNWQYLTQNDEQFQRLFNTVFGQLNNFVAQGNITNQNFQEISNNFSTLFERYQTFYGNAVGEHLNTANEFNVIRQDILQIKQLFAILTGQSNLDEITAAVGQIFTICRQVYQNKGFSYEQATVIKELIEEAKGVLFSNISGVKTDSEKKINELKEKFDREIDSVNTRNKQLEEKYKTIDAMKQTLDSIKAVLGDSIEKKVSFSDVIRSVNTSIENLKTVTQNHETRLGSIETDMAQMKADASSLSEKVDQLASKYTGDCITRQELDDFKRQVVDTFTAQQQLEMQELSENVLNQMRNEMAEKLGNISIAMEASSPGYAQALSNVENSRAEYRRSAAKKAVEFENKFTRLYKKVLPNKATVMNDLTQNVNYGITLVEYIEKVKSGIDQIKNDIMGTDSKLDLNDFAFEKDKILNITLLLYMATVFENLIDYKDLVFALPDHSTVTRENIVKAIDVTRKLSTILCTKDTTKDNWDGVVNNLKMFISILEELKVDSDTSIENVMAITKTRGDTMTDAENAQKAWSIIVTSCGMMESGHANDPITILLNTEVTLSRSDLIRILMNTTRSFLPRFADYLEKILSDHRTEQIEAGEIDSMLEELITKIKLHKDSLMRHSSKSSDIQAGSAYARSKLLGKREQKYTIKLIDPGNKRAGIGGN